MLIRSQDKKSLSNMNASSGLWINKSTNSPYRITTNEFGSLGSYSTEEKAIKALDMIQNKYLEYYHLKGGPAILRGSQDIVENMWVIPKVFEMPKDEEVEEQYE